MARRTCPLACIKLVALIVSRFSVFPKWYFQALLHQNTVSRARKRSVTSFVPLTIPHINAAVTFLRVFTYVKALNMVCNCPLGGVRYADFLDGQVFHHLCNLYDSGNAALVEEMCSGSMRFYRSNEKWCSRFLKFSFVLPRIPEVVCVLDVSALKLARAPEQAAAGKDAAAATPDSLLQAFEDLTLDDPDYGKPSASSG